MKAARDRIRLWRHDHVQAVRDLFKVEPDPAQKEALSKLGGPLQERRRGALKSCTGAGKTTLLAWEGWIRLLCYAEQGEHPKGAAVSGEGRDNLRDNLWAELAKWRSRSELLMQAFEWTKEMVFAKDHPSTWFLAARSYPKDANEEAIGRALSGLHSLFPFLLFDEVGAAPVALGKKAEQIFTGGVKDGLVLMAGNPTDVNGLLYHIFTILADLYFLVTVTADPDDPKRTSRVPIEHAREQINKYGRDNPWVMATILGLFPPAGFNQLLGVEEVQAAMGRHLRSDQYDYAQKRIGVDCARFGDDSTVIFPRQGLASLMPEQIRGARSNDIAARVMKLKNSWGSEMEFIDGTGGYGSGVVDSLIQAGQSPMEVNFSHASFDSRFLNKRAEMWYEMAEWIKRGGVLPKMPELLGELTAPTYTFKKGKFVIEDKDQIKARLGRSPDYADALALTFALPDMPSQFVDGIKLPKGRLTVQTEYNPYEERKKNWDYDPFAEKE